MNSRSTVTLADGYNGHTARFYTKPLETDGDLVKLACAEPGREYLIRWAHKQTVCEAFLRELRGSSTPEHHATVLP